MQQQPEPWMRGPIAGLHPVAAHLIYTFTQVREELAHWTAGLDELVWTAPHPALSPLGFQLRHLAGSTDRLTTYLENGTLSGEQLAFLKSEQTPGAALQELLAELDRQFQRTEAAARAVAPSDYESPRYIGRKRLPTTAAGLIIHISEHTQRHLGQAVITAKILRAASGANATS